MKYSKVFPVEKMCQMLHISRSSYYHWVKKPVSNTEIQNIKLVSLIKEIHRASKYIYGSPRITDELRAMGYLVSTRRVARLMKEHGIHSRIKRRFKITTNSNHSYRIAPNKLKQQFLTHRENQVWVSDITYIKTQQGEMYIIGWGVVLFGVGV